MTGISEVGASTSSNTNTCTGANGSSGDNSGSNVSIDATDAAVANAAAVLAGSSPALAAKRGARRTTAGTTDTGIMEPEGASGGEDDDEEEEDVDDEDVDDEDDEDEGDGEGDKGEEDTRIPKKKRQRRDPIVTRDPLASFPERNRIDLVMNWLRSNFELAPTSSLPRLVLYTNYSEFCESVQIARLNAAGFGRLLRQTFADLQTRRLGHRGQSKYFYQGIQVRASSPLSQRPDIINSIRRGERRAPPTHRPAKPSRDDGLKKSITPRALGKAEDGVAAYGGNGSNGMPQPFGIQHAYHSGLTTPNNFMMLGQSEIGSHMAAPFQTGSQAMDWPKIGSAFVVNFETHLQVQMDLIDRVQYNEACQNFAHFWEQQAPQLLPFLQSEEFLFYIRDLYVVLFSMHLNKLLPSLMRSLPMDAIKEIRDYALKMETTAIELRAHILDLLHPYIMETVKAFAQGLRRGMFLNHVAQAVQGVITSPEQVHQMLQDWITVDWTVLSDQAHMIAQTHRDVIAMFESNIQVFLRTHQNISKWIEFFDSFAAKCLPTDIPPDELPRICRGFIMKWTYVTSLLVRDLAVRAAPSFGSFQVLRLFADEFLQAAVDDHYTRVRFPLYRGTRIIVIHPSLLMSLEATQFLVPRFSAPPPQPLLPSPWTTGTLPAHVFNLGTHPMNQAFTPFPPPSFSVFNMNQRPIPGELGTIMKRQMQPPEGATII